MKVLVTEDYKTYYPDGINLKFFKAGDPVEGHMADHLIARGKAKEEGKKRGRPPKDNGADSTSGED